MPAYLNPYKSLPLVIQPIVKAWSKCKDCDLHSEKCNYVFYRGDAPCDVLFIGEAPGNDEDLCGLPFVGRSGRLLDRMLEDVRGEIGPFSFGITNIVCCIPKDTSKSPRGVRPPTKDEAEACRFRLIETIRRSSPKLVVLLGQSAKKWYRSPPEVYGKDQRGRTTKYTAPPTFDIQHPAYILRKGGLKSLDYQRNLLYLQEKINEVLNGKETN